MVPLAPLLPSLGGSLLALSTSMNLSLFGRITGISGILNNAFVTPNQERQWRYSFLSGLVSGGLVLTALKPEWIGPFTTALPITALAGFLVGAGALMGNGCTSGHGLCGLPRFSVRSFSAISTFMISGAFAAIMRSRVLSSEALNANVPSVANPTQITAGIAILLAIAAFVAKPKPKKDEDFDHHPESALDLTLTYLTGLLFGVGLGISGMCMPHKVTGFLNFVDNWDPSLMFVMGSGVTINALFFAKILSSSTPLMRRKFGVPANRKVDVRLLIGSVLFGLGWGLAGLCPGPGVVGLASGSFASYVYMASLLVGFKAVNVLDSVGALPK
eukprot:TRINITY_DN1520_c0_g1_i1.p1 TRINITY_DN1520_c0_g1~~TRINITY_DN1520_c0_g1_i1.p1  ORF type:complete len:330 (-),score=64.36 TRINITY_DN1520_c0_g1_i1:265-1254(-)